MWSPHTDCQKVKNFILDVEQNLYKRILSKFHGNNKKLSSIALRHLDKNVPERFQFFLQYRCNSLRVTLSESGKDAQI